ncbi:LysR family transcriptional regulator [Acinetobacter apis]|uniref:DNA-binding transcriptional regulator, LysR family n=1 Tax=Acinetobacter apis TaxID=1229165 RepID=A0A217EFS8_9GAMM|nr:LysR family transcriptional regulator [Acinetobacter apis]SNQ29046.1 DNA-binding transcriptional regulator, LysR family [Acinetobacter apis]
MSTNQSLNLLQEMAVFVKVVDTGSFSEAARQLGQTPSAVSRAVSRLERALAVKLLQRTTRKLGLSESGQQIYVHCAEMLKAAQAVVESSGHLSDEPHGVIRLSVPKAIGHYMIHPHLPEFFQRYPNVSVHLLLEDRYIDFIDDAVDAVIRITNAPTGTLMGKRLTTIPHVVVATPQYLKQYGQPTGPHELKQHQCICLGEQPSDAKWKFIQVQKSITVSVQGRYYANHTGIRLNAALQHMGIASLPYFVAQHAIREGTLIQVLPDWTFETYYSGEAWLLYPPTRYLPSKMKVLIQFLLEKLADEPTLTLLNRVPNM